MSNLLNALFLASSVLFLAVTFMQTLREPPPPEVLARWRLGRWQLGPFWIGDRLRLLSLVLFSVSAACGVVSALASGVDADWHVGMPWLLVLAGGLTVLAAGSVLFSVVLYWRPSAAKTHGF